MSSGPGHAASVSTPAVVAAGPEVQYPRPWVRCIVCKEVAPYGSPDLVPIAHGLAVVYVHRGCVKGGELDEWSREPPKLGG